MSTGRWIVAALVACAPRVGATSCERLKDLKVDHVTIVAAEEVAAGSFSLPAPVGSASPERFRQFQRLGAFCRVQAISRPTARSEINIETWMPVSGWNGRYLGVGNGGYAGSISYNRLGEAVAAGYATSSTDTGHRGSSRSSSWAEGSPMRQIDFDHRAIHETAVTSKALILAFYGNVPRASYFNACSNGGRQGLMEAERYPADYDGIFAGAPALYIGFTARVAGNFDAFAKRGGKIIIYHGGEDSPETSIALYGDLARRHGESRVGDFLQLYVIPGMGHCGTGPLPNDVGQWVRPSTDAQHSLLKALEVWVEEGRAPSGVIATRFVRDGDAESGVQSTQMLRPYRRSP